MRIVNFLLASALTLSLVMPVLADNPNPTDLKNHPRVDQVNQRVKNQKNRIKAGVKSGKISKTQAAQLHGERKAIKGQEHAMRKADDGHLTKGDQKQLNAEENARSQQIKDEKHP